MRLVYDRLGLAEIGQVIFMDVKNRGFKTLVFLQALCGKIYLADGNFLPIDNIKDNLGSLEGNQINSSSKFFRKCFLDFSFSLAQKNDRQTTDRRTDSKEP